MHPTPLSSSFSPCLVSRLLLFLYLHPLQHPYPYLFCWRIPRFPFLAVQPIPVPLFSHPVTFHKFPQVRYVPPPLSLYHPDSLLPCLTFFNPVSPWSTLGTCPDHIPTPSSTLSINFSASFPNSPTSKTAVPLCMWFLPTCTTTQSIYSFVHFPSLPPIFSSFLPVSPSAPPLFSLPYYSPFPSFFFLSSFFPSSFLLSSFSLFPLLPCGFCLYLMSISPLLPVPLRHPPSPSLLSFFLSYQPFAPYHSPPSLLLLSPFSLEFLPLTFTLYCPLFYSLFQLLYSFFSHSPVLLSSLFPAQIATQAIPPCTPNHFRHPKYPLLTPTTDTTQITNYSQNKRYTRHTANSSIASVIVENRSSFQDGISL